MTLLRAILISLLAFASTFAIAAEPKSDLASANSSSPGTHAQFSTNLEVPRLVPWFTGVKPPAATQVPDWSLLLHRSRPLLQPGTLGENTCYKLRVYKVKRQERFREGESGSQGYTSCQWSSKFQVHSAVQTSQEQSH